MIATKLQ